MSSIESLVLGALQGITEFLPISSTGHLILARSLFGIDDANALAFDAVLHLATAAAVILYFHRDLWNLFQALLRKLGRLPVNERDLTLLKAIAIGTIPAVLFGLSLETTMETLFRSPLLVAAILVLGSGLFIYAEWVHQHRPADDNEMTVKKGLLIGLFQALALIPGMSRSGATISGGMLLGLSRSESARFAFLLAVPVILGAGTKKLLELIASDTVVNFGPILMGAAAAFVVGLLAIHFMLSFVRKYSLWPFVWYRLFLAALVVFIVLYG